jgi:hypothetical protein
MNRTQTVTLLTIWKFKFHRAAESGNSPMMGRSA